MVTGDFDGNGSDEIAISSPASDAADLYQLRSRRMQRPLISVVTVLLVLFATALRSPATISPASRSQR